jgi:hypothetical protein
MKSTFFRSQLLVSLNSSKLGIIVSHIFSKSSELKKCDTKIQDK